MEIGSCVGCGAEDIEINEDEYCNDCAELENLEKAGNETGESEDEI